MPSIVGYPYPDHSGKAADAGGAGLSEWEQLLATPLREASRLHVRQIVRNSVNR